jgi:N-methylhydantoinase A
MQKQGLAWLESEAIAPERRRILRVIEARYKGQNHEVQVPLNADLGLHEFLELFHAAHCREYGYDIASRPVEIVNCRLKAVGRIERPPSRFEAPSRPPQPKSVRHVLFDEGWMETPIYDRAALPIGHLLRGPAVIDEMSATTLLAPGQNATVDAQGNLNLEVTA